MFNYSPTSLSPFSANYIPSSIPYTSPLVSPLYPLSSSPYSIDYETYTLPIITPYSDDALIESPVLSSLNLTYTKPAFGFYENMNTDRQLQERMVKHFYLYKTMGDWIYDDFLEVLGYFQIGSKDDVKLISSLDKYDEESVDKDSDEDIEKKIDFLKTIFKMKDMRFLLENIVKERGINWYDLPHREKLVMKSIKRYMIKKISNFINKNKN